MKIALAQTNHTIGAFEENLENIARVSQKALGKGARLVIFPELALAGYPPKDLLERPDFVKKANIALERLCEKRLNIAILLGTITENTTGIGKPLFNSAVLIDNGRIVSTIHKQLLPTYDVFDEARYFKEGDIQDPVTLEDLKIGITICEDIWNEPGLCPKCESYERDPVKELVKKGVDLLVNISSSPFCIGKLELRKNILKALSIQYNIPFLYCNSVGGQDCLVFDGASFCMSQDGQVVCQAHPFEEDLVIYDTYTKRGEIHSVYSCDEEAVSMALVLALRDYTRRCGIKKVTLGLSGGIDSSLTACLAVDALGRKNVLGVLMPSPYTSKESIEDALELARNLNIETVTLPITEIFESYMKTLNGIFSGLPMNVTEENIQARIRGNLLMAISNKLGHMVLSTGNKSEFAVGYCTLYGDMSGGYALISDVPKQLVYRVSRFINRKHQVIPERVFEKPPSAELRPNQKDQDDLPPYEILDPILELYLEERLSVDEICKRGFDEETVKRIVRMVDRNEYKRIQAPLGPKITSKAFCCGRRYPVAHGYRPF